MIFDLSVLLRIGLVMAIPAVFACTSVTVAALSAPQNRHVRIHRRYVVGGLFLSFIGVGMMAFGAWSAREDSRYGGLVLIGLLLVILIGGGLLLLGFGPFASWLLEILGRCTERLPLPVRLAARDLAGRRATTAPAIMMTAMATSFGIALTIVAVGMTAQDRAAYSPSARPGTLVVRSFPAEQAGAVRAAIQRELPGVPIAQSEIPRQYRYLGVYAENVDLPDESVYSTQVIGDETLLRYITGDQSTPYDEGKAVVVTTADVKVDSVVINYNVTGNDGPLTSKTIAAIVVRTVDPHRETIFVPAKVVRDIGYQLEPDELIVDPSLHRTSASEQERLDSRLGDVANTYVERGFQTSTGWLVVAAAALLIVVCGSLAAGVGKITSSRPGRVLRRAGGGSAASFRWFGASHAGLSTLCGTVLGAVAGCPIGMLLIWPLTARSTWESPPRVPFETPWLTIAAVVVGLPVLAAALGGLLARERAGGEPTAAP
ncbi:hypothetical protein [Nonomuraea sp. NEAU-A123]|uniref:hypothetical protein n=1 Tax=Nonomuraea sp. NEAU-A123 TaxID=2839649 RepID=UPI001BE401E3|nr:hypothetical protein [Nonomuraea sp. NEAU-A123]MBT2230298.1 hypothetical protein [Nonomuraea sp. NEAU-A123]